MTNLKITFEQRCAVRFSSKTNIRNVHITHSIPEKLQSARDHKYEYSRRVLCNRTNCNRRNLNRLKRSERNGDIILKCRHFSCEWDFESLSNNRRVIAYTFYSKRKCERIEMKWVCVCWFLTTASRTNINYILATKKEKKLFTTSCAPVGHCLLEIDQFVRMPQYACVRTRPFWHRLKCK